MALPFRLVTPTIFERELSTGKTKPCIFSCRDLTEPTEPEDDYVVKFRSDLIGSALYFEFFGFLLARHFGLRTPDAVVVDFSPSLAAAVSVSSPDVGSRIAASAGASNFGTRYLTGVSTWSVGRRLSPEIRSQAALLFAFDALTENADRRNQRPNMLVSPTEIIAIDHEHIFSFIYDLGGGGRGISSSGLNFLREHVFYSSLRGSALPLDDFERTLEGLSADLLDSFAASVPNDCKCEHYPRIREHLLLAADDPAIVVRAIREVLA